MGKVTSLVGYNTDMTDSTSTMELPDIILQYKHWGQMIDMRCAGVSDAIEQAVALIDAAEGIPKSISVNGMVIYTEADINKYWSEKFKS